MKNHLESTTQVHKAISHPARMRILGMLKGGELCVCQLTAALDLAPSTVSAHLSELRRAGLITERKEGRWVHYDLAQTQVATRYLELLWLQLRGDEQMANDEAAVRSLRSISVEELCGMSTQRVRRTVCNTKPKRTRSRTS